MLDTDTISNAKIERRNYPALKRRLEQEPVINLAISVVTEAEFLRHLLREIKQARGLDDLQNAYVRLEEFRLFLGRITVAPFDKGAVALYSELMAGKPCRQHPMDCRNAAIALAKGFVMITRNGAHYDALNVPNEDWTLG